MNWTIPGTVIPVDMQEAAHIPEQLSSVFLAGGIQLGQVSAITGLEPYTIQNWVKRGFLSPPVKKRYTLEQLCRIITINMLKPALSLEQICGLLQYINGSLDDESDDLIDDSQLYFLFIRLAVYHRKIQNSQGREEYLNQVLSEYTEPVPGARERVGKVLRIMLTAWAASQLRLVAEKMANELS
ncbi:MAG: DUF1836 domain-containing protein [Oscillospiraceae bacterium]|nr:DUF1836 domain-containing protein [Oscillospiraceae bacterium]